MEDCQGSSQDCILCIVCTSQLAGASAVLFTLQGTADAVRQYSWLFRDIKNRNVEDIVILSGDHLYRMDYMKVQFWVLSRALKWWQPKEFRENR